MRTEVFFNWVGITLAVINGIITGFIPIEISLGIVSTELCQVLRDLGMDPVVLLETHKAFK